MSKGLGRALRVVVGLALLAAAGAGVYTLVARRSAGGDASKYRTEPVSRGDLIAAVTATGTLSAVTTVQVGSQVSGIIARLHADYNSTVAKGQLLAELDPTPFEAQVAQRRADLMRSQVELANNQVTLRRQERLQAEGLVAEAELDAARAAFDISRAQLDQSKAALSQSETNLRYARISSPIDGVVVARQYDVGQTVAASFQAPTLFTIAQDMTKMQVQADVDQSDIGKIEVGQRARFSVDAYPEREFRGRISQVRLNATVNQTVITYPVILEVPNPGEELRPQMTANVTIEVAAVKDVLRVPNAALRFRPEGAPSPSPGGRRPGGLPAALATGGRGDAAPGTAAATESPLGPETTVATDSPLGRETAPASGAAGMDEGRRERWRAAREGRGSGEAGGGESSGGGGFRGPGGRERRGPTLVYVLEPGGKLRPAQVKPGLTDGRMTEVESSELHEGDLVVVGTATTRAAETSGGPRMGGGGGGGGRGGRF